MRKRLVLVFVLVISLFFTATLRVFALVTDTETVAESKGSYSVEVSRLRGNIYDCYGNPLTNREQTWKTVCAPTPQGVVAVGDALSPSDAQPLLRQLAEGFPVCFSTPCEMNGDGVLSLPVYKRYSANPSAVHIIGYCDGEYTGVSGIEKAFDVLLRRETPLKVSFACDAQNRVLAGASLQVRDEEYDPVAGVRLTIDRSIQQICEAAGRKYLKTGAIVVLEVETGKIRACVSLPEFDPEDIAASLDASDSPFINRAFTSYDTGSVFKLCVAAAALEQGITSEIYHCSGSTKVGDQTFGCSVDGGHGTVDLKSAIAKSCNTYFIHLGQKVGAKGIYDMARRFGFGTAQEVCTGIKSDAGSLPDVKALQTLPAALANFSFGQGDLLTTPLQIASMIQTIAADGSYYPPVLVESLVGRDGLPYDEILPSVPTKVMSEKNAQFLQECMREVVKSGTGMSAMPETGGAGGKTATAETGWTRNGKKVNHAWFAGFYPGENPEYAIVVLAENGVSGSQSAAPVFKEIANGLAGYVGTGK